MEPGSSPQHLCGYNSEGEPVYAPEGQHPPGLGAGPPPTNNQTPGQRSRSSTLRTRQSYAESGERFTQVQLQYLPDRNSSHSAGDLGQIHLLWYQKMKN